MLWKGRKLSESFSENLFLSLQRLIPLISSILLLFLSYIPIDIAFSSSIRPVVSLICAYFWVVHRPDLFNLGSVYVLGIVEDVITSAPFGSNVFMLLLMYLLASNLAKYFSAKPFVFTWYVFAGLAFVVMLARWLLVSVYYSQFLPLGMLMFSVLATAAFYPVFSFVNAFIQNRLIREEV